MKNFYCLTLALFLSLIFVVELQATVYTWGGSTGNWNVPTNWSPNGVPGATDDVIINAGGPTLVSDVTIQNLTVTSSATIYGDFDITIDGTLSQNCSCLLFAGNGDVIVNGAFDWTTGTLGDGIGTGTVTVNGLTTMPTGSAGHWVNRKSLVFNGDIAWQAGSIGASNDGSITIAPGATLTETATTSYLLGFSNWGGTGTFLNQGTFIRSGTALLFVVGNTFLNSGTLINQLTGGIRFQGPLVNEPTGIIKGLGSVIINGSFTNDGTIAPGTPVGNLVITRSSLTTSTLEIEISGDEGPGSGHDRLQVIGNYIADGTLHGLLLGGFEPDSGATFQLLTTTGTVSGVFDNLSLPVHPENWEVTYNSNNIVLKFLMCLDTFYVDVDGDGYGNVAIDSLSCDPVVGYVTNADDCDDNNAFVHPLATEICNGIDDDCDGLLDDADDSFNGVGPVANANSGLEYCTIQSAIDAASPGDVINVDAGTYTETIVVNKSLTINGPNSGTSGCGMRGGEAIIMPPTSQPFYDGSTEVRLMQIEAANVSVRGLTFDGDNPSLLNSDGGPIDAADGIDVYSDVEGIVIENNIFKNLNEGGVTGYPSGSSSLTGNIISGNKFDNIPGDAGTGFPLSGYGIAVLIYNNFYANVEDNCMTNVRIGVQTGNYNLSDAGTSRTIDGNTIDFNTIGIWHNLHYQDASAFDITNNTLSTPNDTTSSGLFVSSLQTAVDVNVEDNNVTGAYAGVELWNNPTTSNVTIHGGVLTNCVKGVFANNYDGYSSNALSSAYILDSVTISGGTTGVHVKDNSLNGNAATVSVQIQHNTSVSGAPTGVKIEGGSASASFSGATPASFTGQAMYIDMVSNGTDAPATDIVATAVSFDGQTGLTASLAQLFTIENKINHEIDWNAFGFVTVKASNAYVTDINVAQGSTNNDYTRLRNAVELVADNWTINLNGSFDWTETNAATSWALGNDDINATGDDYGILVPANLNGINFTAPLGLGTSSIQGPGDVPTVNLEGVLYCDGAGDNQNWTISNIEFLEFDLPVSMFNGAGGVDAYNGTTITNNRFDIATDLNVVAAPSDPNQNIGIHYSFGANQTISNNTFNISGDGVSNGTNYSTTVVMQSNTSGGNVYDGLLITGNTINVLHAQSASPQIVLGIWENGHAHTSNITVSNNTFNNLAAGNNPALNLHRAFRVTSHSGAGTTVTYSGNTVDGANIGFQWITGSNFTGNNPVQMSGNILSNNNMGILVQSNGLAALTNTDFDGATDNARDLQIQTGSVVTTGGANQWAGDEYYVENLSANTLNLTGETFDQADHFRRTDRVYGALDNPASGLIRFDGSNLYLSAPGTGLSDETIPNAVSSAAASGDFVNIESGSYATGLDATSKEITVVPGGSPGCVTLGGDLVLTGGDALAIEVNGTTPCTTYDQLVVNGNVNLGGANLSVTLGYTPVNGDQIMIIDNDLGDAVVGQFAQGGSIIVSGNYFLIDYAGGDGNDVVLTLCGGILNTATMETFCTIQGAIDDANTLNGHTLMVAAGTYAENIIVHKSLAILGPNSAINPCSGSRMAEAIVVPGTAAISSGEIFHVAASNVTISGLTIDGDNTSLTSGYSSTNGADIDAAEGITVYETGINGLTVTNNIIQNLSYFGVTLYDYPAGVPSTGHTIADNKIQDLGTYDAGSGIPLWGGGVLLYNNQYAAVTNNCISNVRIGVQTGNYYLANPGSSTYQVISGNTISTRRRGIFHNLAYNSASPYTLSGNTITGVVDANETASWDGILLASMSPTASTSSGNTIDGTAITAIQATGISVWNCQAAPLISGGTISGVDLGINVNNFEGYPNSGSNAGNTFATIDGVTVTGATIAGIRINDNPSNSNGATVYAEVKGNTTVSGSPVGILVHGPDATGDMHNIVSSITGNDIGVDVDGGTATLFQNSITNNGTGVRVTNSGNLTSANQNFVTGNTVDGILIEVGAGNIGGINENDLSGNTGYAINDLKLSPAVAATCNWYGSTVPAAIAAEINGNVMYTPYLVSGTDNAPVTDGFQPTGSCAAPCLPFTIITSSTPAGCLPATDGTALVNSTSGGTAPYTFAWSTMPVQTSAMATGLAIGTYTVTVTDLSGCTSSAGVTVDFNGQAFLYADADEDGYGNPGIDTVSCTPILGYVSNDDDCDDIDPSVNPSETELCNGIDDNCNGQTDEGLLIIYNTDLNGDGVVNTTDFLVLIGVFNQPCAGCAADINQDGVVSTLDFLLLLSKFGSSDPVITECIPADPIDFQEIYGDILYTAGNGHWTRFFEADGDLNEKVLKSWLAEKEESAWNARLELYPNPASDEITIHLHELKVWSELIVTDQIGRIILRRTLQAGEEIIKLDLKAGSFNNGIYYATVNYGDGVLISRLVVIN